MKSGILIRMWQVCFVLGSMALYGQGLVEYVLRVPPGQLSVATSRYGLTVLDKIPGQEVYLVRGPAGLWPESDDDDDDEIFLEPNRIVRITEVDEGALKTNRPAPAVAQALNDQSLVTIAGVTGWSGYMRQGAFNVVRLAATQAAFGVGREIVAVIDTGIDPNHPVLKDAMVLGYDFVRNRAGYPSELDDLNSTLRSILDPFTTAILDSLAEVNPFTTAILDSETLAELGNRRLPVAFGHGTMVSGLIRRVAPGARIMPLKPFGPEGRATLYNIFRAIYFAEANGARVINMSFSMATPSDELERAVQFVSARGVTCIASAGNLGREMLVWPAALSETIGVASTTLRDTKSGFSNFGDNIVRIAAPGEALVTTFPGGRYAAAFGTSFAAPLVSGTVALMLGVNPQLGWEWADAALSEAAPLSGNLGSGRLDMMRAVRKATELR